MYKISDITAVGGKMIIKLDSEDGGDAAFTVGREFCPFELSPGDALSELQMSKLEDADLLTEAFEKALSALSYTPHSKASLVRKLTTKYRIEKLYAESAADHCEARGYIDEESQARRIAQNAQRSKNYGPRRIAAELISKGYKKSAVQSALESTKDGVDGAAYRALVKKAKIYPEDREERNKIKAALARMGHGAAAIERAFEKLRNTEDDE